VAARSPSSRSAGENKIGESFEPVRRIGEKAIEGRGEGLVQMAHSEILDCARRLRTRAFFQFRAEFMQEPAKEIAKAILKARRAGYTSTAKSGSTTSSDAQAARKLSTFYATMWIVE
jgi:hypothetical protein